MSDVPVTGDGDWNTVWPSLRTGRVACDVGSDKSEVGGYRVTYPASDTGLSTILSLTTGPRY